MLRSSKILTFQSRFKDNLNEQFIRCTNVAQASVQRVALKGFSVSKAESEGMARWYLQILGTPQLASLNSEQGETVRFRYRDTWLLLTSLALEPQLNRRDALIHRLGFESKTFAKETFRLRLHDLRHGAAQRKESDPKYCGIGQASLLTEGEVVALAPGAVTTDLQELEEVLCTGRLLTTPKERIACLKRGTVLLRGPLLDGFDAALYPDPWLETLRFRADRLASELWLLLAQELDTVGERRSAFDAARKAYTLSPENPETLELLLSLAEGVRERDEVVQLSKQLGVEGLFSRLEELEKDGQALTISEENALLEAVKLRLSQLSQAASFALKQIACFPQDFTAEQAAAVASVSPEILERLVKAFPLRKSHGRFSLLPALRRALKSLLTETEIQRFAESHAQFFSALVDSWHTSGIEREPFRARMEGERDNLFTALLWFQTRPVSYAGVGLILGIWFWLGGVPEIRLALHPLNPYLEAAVEKLSGYEAAIAAELRGNFAMDQQDFPRALHWFLMTQKHFTQDPTHFFFILLSAHHAAQDEVFDHYADLILNHFPIPSMTAENKARFLETIHCHVATNHSARQNYDKALEHNERAFSLRRELGLSEDSSPPLWGQRATILWGLGRVEESEQCWDQALKGYEAQKNLGGVAECYQEIGRLASLKGQGGLGVSLLRQAIVLFEESGNPGAVAAAEGTLGDICLELGEYEKARVLYEKGLSYWQAQNHPRWTERFEKRLKSLSK